MTMAESAVSDLVRLDAARHILKLIDIKATCTPALPEMRDQLSQQVRAAMLRQACLTELLKPHPPVLNERALSNQLITPSE